MQRDRHVRRPLRQLPPGAHPPTKSAQAVEEAGGIVVRFWISGITIQSGEIIIYPANSPDDFGILPGEPITLDGMQDHPILNGLTFTLSTNLVTEKDILWSNTYWGYVIKNTYSLESNEWTEEEENAWYHFAPRPIPSEIPITYIGVYEKFVTMYLDYGYDTILGIPPGSRLTFDGITFRPVLNGQSRIAVNLGEDDNWEILDNELIQIEYSDLGFYTRHIPLLGDGSLTEAHAQAIITPPPNFQILRTWPEDQWVYLYYQVMPGSPPLEVGQQITFQGLSVIPGLNAQTRTLAALGAESWEVEGNETEVSFAYPDGEIITSTGPHDRIPMPVLNLWVPFPTHSYDFVIETGFFTVRPARSFQIFSHDSAPGWTWLYISDQACSQLKVGDTVTFHGLTANPGLNGQSRIIRSLFDADLVNSPVGDYIHADLAEWRGDCYISLDDPSIQEGDGPESGWVTMERVEPEAEGSGLILTKPWFVGGMKT